MSCLNQPTRSSIGNIGFVGEALSILRFWSVEVSSKTPTDLL